VRRLIVCLQRLGACVIASRWAAGGLLMQSNYAPRIDRPLAKKLSAFAPLNDEEQAYLVDLQARFVLVKRGQELLREGEDGQKVYIIQSGWACSYKDLPDGRRQVISFPLPGDCVGLHSALLRASDHSFRALTDAIVSSIEVATIMELIDEQPRLRTALLWSVARDEAMVVEHLVNVGRRNALERAAHFFMELAERLTLVGLATETQFECPLNQYVLADALGLSPIHVNRVLRQLREQNLLTIKAGKVIINDLPGLRSLAGYVSVNDRKIYHSADPD
jgi:CRP-like cAMP-binding protein